MRLVIAAFTTLSEADTAVRAALDAGYRPEQISAYGRTGGGRLVLAGQVMVQPTGEPARLVSRAERARAWAVAGAVGGVLVAGVVLAIAWLLGAANVPDLGPLLRGWPTVLVVLLLAAALGAALAALARRTDGLPHDLAYRYGVRLDQGDTVLAVRALPGAEARAVQDLLGIHGAIFAHVTRGRVELIDPPPPAAALAPSEN